MRAEKSANQILLRGRGWEGEGTPGGGGGRHPGEHTGSISATTAHRPTAFLTARGVWDPRRPDLGNTGKPTLRCSDTGAQSFRGGGGCESGVSLKVEGAEC